MARLQCDLARDGPPEPEATGTADQGRPGLPKLQHSTIRSYYLKFGVKSVRPDYGYLKTQNEKRQLRERQMEFARLQGR